jgi:hypothetical protein
MWTRDNLIKQATPVHRAIRATYGKKKNASRMAPLNIADFKLLLAVYNNGNAQAHRSLIELTGCDFDRDFDAWLDWYKGNAHRPPAAWSLDCIESRGIQLRGMSWKVVIPSLIKALMHAEIIVRIHALRLLKKYTGRVIGFPARACEETRKSYYQRWVKWWRSKGAEFLKEMSVKKAPADEQRRPRKKNPVIRKTNSVLTKRRISRDLSSYYRLDKKVSARDREIIGMLRIVVIVVCACIAIATWVCDCPGNIRWCGFLAAVIFFVPAWMTLDSFVRKDTYFNPMVYWGVFLGGTAFMVLILSAG